MDEMMDQCESSQLELNGIPVDDLGLTLSPGSQPQRLDSFLPVGQEIDPFEYGMDLDHLVDFDQMVCEIEGSKKRPVDQALPNFPLPTSKKQHLEVSIPQSPDSLFDADDSTSLLHEPVPSNDGMFPEGDASLAPTPWSGSAADVSLDGQTPVSVSGSDKPSGSNIVNHPLFSSHASPASVSTPASVLAKHKFAIGQQDIANHASLEATTQSNQYPKHVSPYEPVGYYPSAPNLHARVVEVGNDTLNSRLQNAKRRMNVLTAERNKFQEAWRKCSTLDPDTGKPRVQVLEGQIATLRRVCTTQQRKAQQQRAELGDWGTKYAELAGTYNSLLRDYHRLCLPAVSPVATSVLQPSSDRPSPVVPCADMATVRQHPSEPHGPGSMHLSGQPSAANPLAAHFKNPTNSQQPARTHPLSPQSSHSSRFLPSPQSSSPRVSPVQPSQPTSRPELPDTSRHLDTWPTNRTMSTQVQNPSGHVSSVTTLPEELGPATDAQASPVSILKPVTIDLTNDSDVSSVPATRTAPVNPLTEFHRAFRKKEFKWLQQGESMIDLVESMHNDQSKTKSGAQPSKTMPSGACCNISRTQKTIRRSLGGPYSSRDLDEESLTDADTEYEANNTTSPTTASLVIVTSHSESPTAAVASPASTNQCVKPAKKPESGPRTKANTNSMKTNSTPKTKPDLEDTAGNVYHPTDEELGGMLEEEMMRCATYD